MNTANKQWINDKTFFRLVLGISLAVPVVVVLLRYLPAEMRPNVYFAQHLPFANAILNSMVSVLLIAGYLTIRRTRNKTLHQSLMLGAFALSACFLVSYVLYHFIMPHQEFCKEGVIRYVYFFILATHIILAAAILPMILYTIYHSTSGNYVKHKKIARITFPLWLYVSVTGVLVYVLISPCYNF